MPYERHDKRPERRRRRPPPPEPDYRALAQICLKHKDGDCMKAMERLSSYLRLSPRDRLRLRHLLVLYGKPYVTEGGDGPR